MLLLLSIIIIALNFIKGQSESEKSKRVLGKRRHDARRVVLAMRSCAHQRCRRGCRACVLQGRVCLCRRCCGRKCRRHALTRHRGQRERGLLQSQTRRKGYAVLHRLRKTAGAIPLNRLSYNALETFGSLFSCVGNQSVL